MAAPPREQPDSSPSHTDAPGSSQLASSRYAASQRLYSPRTQRSRSKGVGGARRSPANRRLRASRATLRANHSLPGGRRGKAGAGLAQARCRLLGAVALRGETAQVRGRGRAFTDGVVGLGALSSCLTAEPPLLRLSVVERTLRLSWQRGWRSAPARPASHSRPSRFPAATPTCCSRPPTRRFINCVYLFYCS